MANEKVNQPPHTPKTKIDHAQLQITSPGVSIKSVFLLTKKQRRVGSKITSHYFQCTLPQTTMRVPRTPFGRSFRPLVWSVESPRPLKKRLVITLNNGWSWAYFSFGSWRLHTPFLWASLCHRLGARRASKGANSERRRGEYRRGALPQEVFGQSPEHRAHWRWASGKIQRGWLVFF